MASSIRCLLCAFLALAFLSENALCKDEVIEFIAPEAMLDKRDMPRLKARYVHLGNHVYEVTLDTGSKGESRSEHGWMVLAILTCLHGDVGERVAKRWAYWLVGKIWLDPYRGTVAFVDKGTPRAAVTHERFAGAAEEEVQLFDLEKMSFGSDCLAFVRQLKER
jgi:hypothetical protein